MPASNNARYFDAAYRGFIFSVMAERPYTSRTAADYLDITQAADAFATAVDGQIAVDADANTQLERANLIAEICKGVLFGRAYTNESSANYTLLAQQVAAIYTESLLLLEPAPLVP